MDDFVAYPHRGQIALMILGSASFVAAGFWMLGAFGPPPISEHRSPEHSVFVGLVSVVFFGAMGFLWIRRLFDGREQLRIGPGGIRVTRWSEQTIPWSEVIDVTTWGHRRQTMIVLHLRDRTRFPGQGMEAMLTWLSRSMEGGDIWISLTGTDRSVSEAISAVHHFRAGAGSLRRLSDDCV